MTRLPDTAHTTRPWRIHELAPDFRLEDVWALPTPGGPGDFPRLVEAITSGDPARQPAPVRALFALRLKLGAVLGWDDPSTGTGTGTGAKAMTLRDRLPPDLAGGPSGPDFGVLPFTSLYQTDDEFAAELANRTMHGVLHLGWVPDDDGGHRGQLAVLVKRNGVFGSAYMAAIKPFRHLLVYPLMLRRLERKWRTPTPSGGPAKG